jgi:flagellar basal-body rod protein FlgB
MVQSILDTGTFNLLEQMAVFGQRRHQVLVENLAHIDTVGYRTRDLPVAEFQQALREAVSSRVSGSPPSDPWLADAAAARPPAASTRLPDALLRAAEAAPRNITFQDGNNRSIEHEAMELTKNLMMQNFAVELMSAQMNLLQAVISERA